MRRLPNWLSAFTEYASTSEAPVDALYWTGVVSVAGALRRNVYIDMGHFIFCANHYVVLVAPPGVIGKTTTADLGINLLRAVGQPTPFIKFGPDVITWQALAQCMAESREDSEHAPGEYFPHCSLTLASGEMGNLIDPQNREMLDLYVALWDARLGSFRKVTKGSGSDEILNPWINMIACTTPAWIAGTFPEYAIGGGFTSRCIFVFADKKRQLIAYPSRQVTPAQRALRDDLIHDLERISELRGRFALTPEAMTYGEKWYIDHHTKERNDIDPVRFGGYMSRKQGHIHKLAMVLSACEGDRMIIDKDLLEKAESIVSGTEANMHRVFELIGRSNDAKVANVVLELIGRMGGKMTRSGMHHALLHRYGSDEVGRGINSCLSAGDLVEATTEQGSFLVTRDVWNKMFPMAPR